jgi:hypothetical protein
MTRRPLFWSFLGDVFMAGNLALFIGREIVIAAGIEGWELQV